MIYISYCPNLDDLLALVPKDGEGNNVFAHQHKGHAHPATKTTTEDGDIYTPTGSRESISIVYLPDGVEIPVYAVNCTLYTVDQVAEAKAKAAEVGIHWNTIPQIAGHEMG